MEDKKNIIPHILVCYDASPSSYKILSYLKEVFQGVELEITFLQIVSPPSFSQTLQTDIYKKLQQEMLVEEETKKIFLDAENQLREIAEKVKEFIPAKTFYKVFFQYGDIAESIISFSQRNMFDGIVVGRRGLSKILTFVLGSVTYKLINLSPIPVWLIRGNNWNNKFLVCLDLGETGLKLVDYISFIFARHKNVEITFFHVFYPFSDFKYFEGSIEELIEKTKNEEYKEFFVKIKNILLENGMSTDRIKIQLKRGLFGPAGEIIRTAKKGNYTNIVVGRRGRNKGKKIFLGSVSQKIISYFEDRAIWVVN